MSWYYAIPIIYLGIIYMSFLKAEPTINPQIIFNQNERKLETIFDKTISDFIQKETDLVLDKINIYHINKNLKQGINTLRYTKSNGFTLLIASFTNALPVFQVAVCSSEDTYSRLTGRITVKERIVNALKVKGMAAFETYPLEENYLQLNIPRYFANRYIKENLTKRVINKKTISLPLKDVTEEYLRQLAIEKIKLNIAKEASEKGIVLTLDEESVYTTVQHIRVLQANFIAPVQLGTMGHFREVLGKDENGVSHASNQIKACGGLTLQATRFKVKNETAGTSQELVGLTWASCSDKDVYSKEYGRKQCYQNIVKDRFQIYSITSPFNSGKEFNNYCIRYLESKLQFPINFTITPELEETSETTLGNH